MRWPRFQSAWFIVGVLAVLAGVGAPPARAGNPIDFEQARKTYWSLQPVRAAAPPAVKDTAWVAGPIDAFVLARLEANGLASVGVADRRTLIRRAYFDLIGLLPTYDQVEAFVNDKAPLLDAFAKVVDELLASPRYGERWGRHWLDVARYADTKGYVFTQEPRYPFAYTFRDYVINAFNADKPFDRFVMEQLAADQLDLGGDKAALAGMGFLTVGRRFSNREPDIIDDRIDVVTRGLMGLTVQCARCHDHKYDPITSRDYYALYGVFASSTEPDDLPVIGQPSGPEYEAFKAELNKRTKAIDNYNDQLRNSIGDELRQRVGDYLEYIALTLPGHQQGNVPFRGRRGELRRRAVESWKQYLDQRGQKKDPVFVVWHGLAKATREGFAGAAKALLERLAKAGADEVNPLVVQAFGQKTPQTMADVARVYGKLLEETYAAHKDKPADDSATEQVRQVLYEAGSPPAMSPDDVDHFKNRAERDHLRSLEKKVEEWHVTSAGAPPRAMIMRDKDNLFQPYVFERGSPERHGPNVDRRFLEVLAPAVGAKPFQKDSGRLELARDIVNPANPLTPRVIVNRVWAWHLGEGLVRTPSDFGFRSDPPTHPELLDYLAWHFVHTDGWSIKKLHRRIMLTSTYMQASVDRPDARSVDAENRLLWRFNRQRLEFEPMRDAMLAVSGRLDTTMGGRPVSVTDPNQTRRSVYAFIDRQDLPGLLRNFDFASPDASADKRPQTTVPQQALFMLNSPFVIQAAKAIAARPAVASAQEPAGKVDALYRIVLSRRPSEDEVKLALAYVQGESGVQGAKLSPWEKLAQVLLLSNEFAFVD
jgi:Protein of unknown function (DUF1553)/Protein of unknown function (DUF1549)